MSDFRGFSNLFYRPFWTIFSMALFFCGFLSLALTHFFMEPESTVKKLDNLSLVNSTINFKQKNTESGLLQVAAHWDEQIQQEIYYDFRPERALEDPFSRIDNEFNIPDVLRPRVAFWFQVYTHFNKNQHIIHHILYPWIVYEVVDTSPFLEGSGPLWLRIQRGRDHVNKRKNLILNTLKTLSKKKNLKMLSAFEKDLLTKLDSIPGKKAYILKKATQYIRVQLGQKDFFLSGLENSNKYLHLMEQEFVKAHLPLELTRIPFVESSFNEKAQSRVGASGIWQIMPHIGKKYSIVNNHIDERNSPIKASKVAAKLLKLNYRILKTWPLAITAYNNGIGNIKKAIIRAKSNDINTIIERNHTGAFKFASSNFYACFLAALHAEKYQNEIFQQTPIEKAKALNKVQYKLKKSWRPKTLVRKADMDINTLLSYNLDLKNSVKRNILLPSGYTLLLPPEKAEVFKTKLF